MSKIRVLIVDDSSTIRRVLTKFLSEDAALEVAGSAANGRIALAKIPQVNPDVVLLDIEMPEMDGLQTLTGLRRNYPKLPVIMFSRLTQPGVEATIEALMLGANDYVAKPDGANDVEECIQGQLLPKIKMFGAKHLGVCESDLEAEHGAPAEPQICDILGYQSLSSPAVEATGEPETVTPRKPKASSNEKVELVAIGCSTGGPNALADVLMAIPTGFPVPIVIAQHMPPDFTRHLADRLSAKANVTIQEGQAGKILEAGDAWIAPGDYHMLLRRWNDQVKIRINQSPHVNSCRPSADVLFCSAAEAYGAGVLAVVLTGMGKDGMRGCEAIREAGGQVVVQDEASSVVWGMPGCVAKAGLADDVLPLEKIGPEIIRRTRR